MARMPSGSPRSVPDPAGDLYDQMLRRWKAGGGGDPNPDGLNLGGPIGGGPIGRPDLGGTLKMGVAGADDDTFPPARTPPADAGASAGRIPLIDDARDRFVAWQHSKPIGHPGFAESLIPVEGSGREALADLQEGHYLGALGNGLLAATDVIPAKALGTLGAKVLVKTGAKAVAEVAGKGLLKDVTRGGLEDAAKGLEKKMMSPGMKYPFKDFGSQTWDASRKWLRRQGFTEAGEDGHHWFIPQNGWGKVVPDWIKNQPGNIMALPHEIHARLHGNYLGQPQFNAIERYMRGTPLWWKATKVSAPGHLVEAANAAGRRP